MVYLVLLMVEGAGVFYNNLKMKSPSNTYGETYEEDRKDEAEDYFWTSVKYAIDNRERLNDGGVTDYHIGFMELENETDERPKKTIYRMTLTPSGAIAVNSDMSKADERAFIEKLSATIGDRYLLTEEPILESQKADFKRLLKPIPKA